MSNLDERVSSIYQRALDHRDKGIWPFDDENYVAYAVRDELYTLLKAGAAIRFLNAFNRVSGHYMHEVSFREIDFREYTACMVIKYDLYSIRDWFNAVVGKIHGVA